MGVEAPKKVAWSSDWVSIPPSTSVVASLVPTPPFASVVASSAVVFPLGLAAESRRCTGSTAALPPITASKTPKYGKSAGVSASSSDPHPAPLFLIASVMSLYFYLSIMILSRHCWTIRSYLRLPKSATISLKMFSFRTVPFSLR